MPSPGVEQAVNDQMAKEFYAAHLYLSMAAYFEDQSLPGFAHWMRMQSDEERDHAMRLFQFILDAGGRVRLQGLDQPPTDFEGPRKVIEQALAHEKEVTSAITALYELAISEHDYPAQLELEWFIKEQTEEERTFGDIVARLKMAGEGGPALLMIDAELGRRASAAQA